MEEALAEEGMTNPITQLHLPADLAIPDGGATGIIYDKGAVFLRTVETIVGREKFDAWLESWFDRHAFEPATSAMFLADMRENLIKGDAELEKELMLDQWVYQPGLPGNAVRPDPAAFAEVDAAAKLFADERSIDSGGWKKWTSAERQRYLTKLPQKLDAGSLAALEESLSLSASGNNEVLFLWLELAMKNRYDPAVPAAEKFLSTVGRRKFVAPLFEALMEQGSWGQPIAKRIYAKTRPTYHAVTQGTVDKSVK
jgi:hypothetical protein